MLWATEEIFPVWLQFTISSELAAGQSTLATLEPGTGMGNWSRGHRKAGTVMTPDAVVASLQLLAAEPGAGSLFICSFMCLHFLTRGTAGVPHSHSQSHSCCYFIPEESKRADRDKNWNPDNAIVHSHCWKQLCSFRSVKAVTVVFVSVLPLETGQGQLSQENQEMEFMAWLFSTCFLNDIEAIWLVDCLGV